MQIYSPPALLPLFQAEMSTSVNAEERNHIQQKYRNLCYVKKKFHRTFPCLAKIHGLDKTCILRIHAYLASTKHYPHAFSTLHVYPSNTTFCALHYFSYIKSQLTKVQQHFLQSLCPNRKLPQSIIEIVEIGKAIHIDFLFQRFSQIIHQITQKTPSYEDAVFCTKTLQNTLAAKNIQKKSPFLEGNYLQNLDQWMQEEGFPIDRIHCIRFYNYDIHSIASLRPLSKILHLQLHKLKKLQNIEAIACLKLQTLRINSCPLVHDTRTISSITSLRFLKIAFCRQIQQMNFVKLLQNLTALELFSFAHVQEIDFSELPQKLQRVSFCYFKNLKNIRNTHNTKLVSLTLYSCYLLKQVYAENKPPFLQALNLSHCYALSDYTPFFHTRTLTSLVLKIHTRIINLKELCWLTNLYHLDVSNCDFLPRRLKKCTRFRLTTQKIIRDITEHYTEKNILGPKSLARL